MYVGAEDGPAVLEVVVDEKQNFEPKLASKRLADGTMVSPKLDDMYPFIWPVYIFRYVKNEWKNVKE